MSALAYAFVLAISVGIPVLSTLVIGFKYRSMFKAFGIGVLTFTLFQVLTRIPLIQYVLSPNADFVYFSQANYYLYVLFLSISAGLFEELGRYLMMKRFIKEMTLNQALAFGLGHGGIEALLLIGIPFLLNPDLMQYGPSLAYAGLERISALMLHLLFSVLVYQSLQVKSKHKLFLSITLHTLVNFVAIVLLSLTGLTWFVELMLLLVALGGLTYIYRQRNLTHEEIIPTL